MKIKKTDLMSMAGLIQSNIIDDYGKDAQIKKEAKKHIKMLRWIYRQM